MRNRFESCLQQAKPLLQELLHELSGQYSYVSILGMDSECKQYSVSNTGSTILPGALLTKCGYVVKVYDGNSYAEYSFNGLTKEEIPNITAAIHQHLMPLTKKLPRDVKVSEYDCIQENPVTLHKSMECEQWPEDLGDEKIIEILQQIHEEGLKQEEKIVDCSVTYQFQKNSKLFLSNQKDLYQDLIWSNGLINAIASDGKITKNCFTCYSNGGGAELLEQMKQGVCKTAKNALELLSSKPIVPGEYDCICSPDCSGILAHEAFGHGVEMDMFVKDRALAKQFVGKYVASPIVTMHDTASGASESGSYFFDDEGVIATDTVVIDHGILKQGISDAQTAMHLNTIPTGNGRRESFERKAYTRMTNTYFEGGHDQLEDMIASISNGYLIECMQGGMEDPKNWGIMLVATIAREIKDGKLTGNVCSPVIMTGYVPDLLKSISMLSENVELNGMGMCGKGHKEYVKVSTGGPYLKARIRLG